MDHWMRFGKCESQPRGVYTTFKEEFINISVEVTFTLGQGG